MSFQLALISLLVSILPIPPVFAHVTLWHPSMYGFNVTGTTFGRDFQPFVPLMHENFENWWFHGHMGFPPNDGDVLELPAGGTITGEIACNKGATSMWQTSSGSEDLRRGDPSPCPGQPSDQWHTKDENDVTGCALAIVDKADPHSIVPEDFTIFSVTHHCVWNRETPFHIPAQMPACTNGVCHCAWFWIHSPESGAQQMYMNVYKCKVTGATDQARQIGKPQLPRRCGEDKYLHRPAVPSNCTIGPKLPMYWYQNERNNMFEDTYTPPVYNDLYGFADGAQNDIFVDAQGHYEGSQSSTTSTTTVTVATTTTVPPATITTSTTASSPTSSSATATDVEGIKSTNSTNSSTSNGGVPDTSGSTTSGGGTTPSSVGTTPASGGTVQSAVTSATSTSSTLPQGSTPTAAGSSTATALGLQDTKPQHCKRRTPAQKAKRAQRRAAREHRKRSSTGIKKYTNIFI